MSNRVMAAARIPKDIFDLHTRNVQEKHAADSLYKGIAAEMALREYLDKDDFAELENRLRDRCTSVGCSTPKQKKSVAAFESNEKKIAQWRIREELKEELKQFATESDNTYGDVFAFAIREYWTNSRSDRIESLYDRLETAIEPWEDSMGNDGVNASVVDRRTAEIAAEVSGDGDILRSDIENAIAEVTSESDYNREKYTPKVAEYIDVEEHPNTEKLFVPAERAEELRENQGIDESGPSLFEQSYDELTADECDIRVGARLCRQATSRPNGKAQMGHSEVLDEFDGDPGDTTIYNIMGRVSDWSGFHISTQRDTKQLRVTVANVEKRDVIEAATDGDETSTPGGVRSGVASS